MNKIIGSHSSPGVYTKFTDLSYAANSIGITTLGLVGETLKGPAFEPMMISDWAKYQDYFGGTSTEKFKNTQYPKYELPYIAKSYLSTSDQLYVCRVLGLSGYNAGPAFILTAEKTGESKKYAIAVLRSRGVYGTTGDELGCNPTKSTNYDSLSYYCDNIKIGVATKNSIKYSDCDDANNGITAIPNTASTISVSLSDYGTFDIETYNGKTKLHTYTVSLNPSSKNYIYTVLGNSPTDGNADIFVEELYDYYLEDLVVGGKVDQISTSAHTITEKVLNEIVDPVADFVRIPEDKLTRNNLGQTYLVDKIAIDDIFGNTKSEAQPELQEESSVNTIGIGTIVKVSYRIVNGKREYFYDYVAQLSKNEGDNVLNVVKVLKYDTYYHLESNDDVSALTTVNDMNDYKERFRCATTPWVVSEIKGDGKNLELKKLFRFHTITDGNAANEQVKISIANIKPDDGTFDVYVRDYNDSDGNQVILESYKNVNMVPGNNKYIGLQIGTLNGEYELKSKYVILEIIENDMTMMCVPGGFLGYPSRSYGKDVISPSFKYNTVYDDTIREKRQYFGLSNLTGVDSDMLSYKGKNAYTEKYSEGYTNGFHLDSTLNEEVLKAIGTGVTVTVDGVEVGSWTTVSPNNVTENGGNAPVLGSEAEMEGTIYENVALRKFTLYPCGGFDGWDIYRNERTNGDEYSAKKYKGNIKGITKNSTFSKINDGTGLNLTGNTITSDYYAYLAGAMQFNNAEKYQINLFATPGIDYVNQLSLTNEILAMIEEERKDSLYVITTPDKPSGASDNIDDMYTSAEASSNLDDSGIDTYYAATYYPWVKYYDTANSMYINLPATKDVLRNMADVDNKKYPWFAPAGIERGNVECAKMHFFTKIEDEDNVYSNRINPLKTFSKDGVKVWGNKTLYSGDTPMNRINTVRLMLYMRKLISEAVRMLIFEPNDTTLKGEFTSIVNPILANIKAERGITDYRLDVSQTPEEMDAHELSCRLWVKPTPTLEYISIEFMVTPQGIDFAD